MASGSGHSNGKKSYLFKKEAKDKSGGKSSSSSKSGLSVKKLKNHLVPQWDPLASCDWDRAGSPGPLAAARIKRDITSLYKEPLPGIFIIPDEANFCIVNCLIIGPFDTPYEGGFFDFVVRLGPSYPLHPPRVRFLTTDAGRVRFNPNLYSSGKVCLSILGTWNGPSWSPASTLGSLLLSIQSLLNEKPYFNEPGFQKEHFVGESEQYNDFVIHETLRVAVCSYMENLLRVTAADSAPKELVDVAKSTFLDFYEHYVDLCKNKSHLDTTEMKDIFSMQSGKYDFSGLITRLKVIKDKLSSLDPPIDESSLGGRESPLSSISEASDEVVKSKIDEDSVKLISEANEFALTEEEELELNSTPGGATSAHEVSTEYNPEGQSLSQNSSDDWFFIDDDSDEENYSNSN